MVITKIENKVFCWFTARRNKFQLYQKIKIMNRKSLIFLLLAPGFFLNSNAQSYQKNDAGIKAIGDRNGSFPGMLAERKFNIVMVNANKDAGENLDKKTGKNITYAERK